MKWKWIYAFALLFGIYEAITLHRYGPLLFFLCCGITYLAVKD